MKRSGFTMIELIFVIVILGILAAVAIPKLAATRDDAKASKAATNLATFINDIGSAYTAKGIATSSDSTVVLGQDACFQASLSASGASLTITSDGASASTLPCQAAFSMATKAGNIGSKSFGGSGVTY